MTEIMICAVKKVVERKRQDKCEKRHVGRNTFHALANY